MTPSPARRWLRPVLGSLIILVWIAIAGIGGPYFSRIGEVAVNDQSTYLPSSAESTWVQKRLADFYGNESIPAIVVAERAGGLTADDQAWLGQQSKRLPQEVPAIVGGVSPALPSEDGVAAQMFVPLTSTSEIRDAVDDLRAALEGGPDGLGVYVTGAAGLSADLRAAFGGVDLLLLLVAVLAVLVILIIVYRSPFLPLMVLLCSMAALCGAVLVSFYMAKAGLFKMNGQVQGILFILVIGATTDYSLLYVSRFREALRANGSSWEATKAAWKGSMPAIVASGGTVIAGVLCLLFSDLASNKALGPVATLGIVFAIVATATFLPAMLTLAGRGAFWPRRLEPAPVSAAAGGEATGGAELTSAETGHTGAGVDLDADTGRAERAPYGKGAWGRIAATIGARARLVWGIVALALVVGCVGLVGLNASGVPFSEFVIGASSSRDGQNVLAAHFPGGSGQPVQVIVPEEKLSAAVEVAMQNEGISGASVVSADSPSGSIPIPTPPGGMFAQATPTVSDGDVLLQLTLVDKADSLEAEATVSDLRTALRAVDPAIIAGGSTALDLDSNLTSARDRNLVMPLVLVVITAILMVLLRSIVAPLLLMATTVLSFGTALGITSLIFNHILHFPGADPSVPLYGFVFLVALGIDYNIFLMTRVREETLVHGTREGVLRGLVVTGGVITSAGVVLAATFAALSVLPILFLVQLSMIVAFGVLLDTLVVRALFVPALVHDIGPKVWWPSKLARRL